jgi:hypothetical protein
MEITGEVQQFIDAEKAKWQEEYLNPVIAERDSLLQLKPKEESEQEKEIARLKAELRHAKVVAKLKDAKLDDFIDLINFDDDDVDDRIAKLSDVLQARQLNNNYIPDQHRQTSKYEQAASQNDTVGMIGAKLSKLFG